MNKWTKS